MGFRQILKMFSQNILWIDNNWEKTALKHCASSFLFIRESHLYFD